MYNKKPLDFPSGLDTTEMQTAESGKLTEWKMRLLH